MADSIIMPKLGFDMSEGKLVHWVKAIGETVAKGEIIADIETDKATVEVASTLEGIVASYLVPEGEIVPVGTPIAVITAPGEKYVEGTVPSASGKADQKNLAVSTAVEPARAEQALPSQTGTERRKVSPLARRLAAEAKVNLATISGSGTGGRIVRRDIEKALESAQSVTKIESTPVQPVVIPVVPVEKMTTPVTATLGQAFIPTGIPDDQRVPVDRLRAIIGKRMTEAKQQVPHFYVTHTYDVDAMIRLRQQVNEFVPEDSKISINDFIVKATALTLRQHPNLNSSISGSEILRHGHVNIGVAVGIEGGLLTVVCRDADQKPLRMISSEIREMVTRARSGKMRPTDIEGSTFSISNLGMYDVEHFIAIINPPEAAILAVGSAQKVPVVVGDEVKVANRMKATISADHRVTDGVEAAQFLKTLAIYLENPLSLLI